MIRVGAHRSLVWLLHSDPRSEQIVFLLVAECLRPNYCPCENMAICPALRPRTFRFLFTLPYILRPISATCFTPNGTDRNALSDTNGETWFQPCETGNGYSMCCATSRSKFPDDCRSDGLCHNQAASLVWRESCTDPTWQSPSCIKLCITGTSEWLPELGVTIAFSDNIS